ncbi:MAG: type IV toxin-antitoxin system AbiEi family antitoxin domain-containing protein, partial [Myxococcales bacterium]
MNASEALGRLKSLRVPAATTADAAAVLGLSGTATTHMLRRLTRSGLVTPVRRGVWALAERPDRLVLAEYVTAPYPAYLSLQTALYQHGMIEQIPSMTYVVSLARSGRVDTTLGT